MQTNTDHQEENQEQQTEQVQVQQEEVVTPPVNPTSQSYAPPIYAQQLPEKNNMGLAGFILSIVAIILSWVPFVGWLCWLLGLVLSIVGLFKKPKGFAIAGLIISLLGLILMVVLLGALGLAFAAAASGM